MFRRADMRESADFLAALLVAAYGVVRRPKAGVRRLYSAVRLWLSGFGRDGKVAAGVAKRRLDFCRQCVLFFPKRGTCGNPLDKKYGNLGCNCLMRKKVRYKDARCWLDENARDENGQPDANGWEFNGVE